MGLRSTEKGTRRLVSSGGGPMAIGMLHEVARDPEEQTHEEARVYVCS